MSQYVTAHSKYMPKQIADVPNKLPGMETVHMVEERYQAWLKRRGFVRPTFNGKAVKP
jgi:hypothetical protein